MNRPSFLGLDRPVRKVDRLAENIEHATQHFRADRHRNRCAQIDRGHVALHAVGRLHRNGAHPILAQVLLDLGDDVDVDAALTRFDMQRVVDGGQMPRELAGEDRSDHLHHFADCPFRFGIVRHDVSESPRVPVV